MQVVYLQILMLHVASNGWKSLGKSKKSRRRANVMMVFVFYLLNDHEPAQCP